MGLQLFILVVSSILKIGLAVGVLEFSEYLLLDKSSLIIFAKWESITLADILINFT